MKHIDLERHYLRKSIKDAEILIKYSKPHKVKELIIRIKGCERDLEKLNESHKQKKLKW